MLPHEIFDLAWSPDSARFAAAVGDIPDHDWPEAGSNNITWHVFEIGSDRTLKPLAKISGVETIRFSADGRRLIEVDYVESDGFNARHATFQPNGRVWDPVSGDEKIGEKTPTFADANSSPFRIESDGSRIRVVDRRGKPYGVARYAGWAVTSATVSPSGDTVVAESQFQDEFKVEVWTVGDFKEAPRQWNEDRRIPALLYETPDRIRSARFRSKSSDLILNLMRGNDPVPVSEFLRHSSDDKLRPVSFFDELRVADFSPNGVFLLAGHTERRLVLWSLRGGAFDRFDPEDAGGDQNAVLERAALQRHDTIVALAHPTREAIPLNAQQLADRKLPVSEEADLSHPENVIGWLSPSGDYAFIERNRYTEEVWDVPHQRKIVSLEGQVFAVAFSPDEHLAAFQIGTELRTFNFVTKQIMASEVSPPVEGPIFSKNGCFILFFDHYSHAMTVLNAEGLTSITNYYSPIQDRLWAAEEITDLSVSPEFLAAATALAGRRLEDEGGMQNLPPDEWLHLRANSHGGASVTERITRWLLQWPEEKQASF